MNTDMYARSFSLAASLTSGAVPAPKSVPCKISRLDTRPSSHIHLDAFFGESADCQSCLSDNDLSVICMGHPC